MTDERTKLQTSETVLQRLSTAGLDLDNLPDRLDARQMEALRAYANSPLPDMPPCDSTTMSQALRMMLSVLPRRHADDVSGELFVEAYQRQLGQYSASQIMHICDHAIAKCKWFPTVAECHELAAEWRRSDREVEHRAKAQSAIWAERRRMNEKQASREDDPWKPEPGEIERIKREVAEQLAAEERRT